MPKRDDLKTILIIGSGPIVIGQACEFDYSGTQACKALREEGYQVVLVNSNPATIMTDPQMADRTYVEPITPETVEKVIAKEHGGEFQIGAVLPTLGGQTALNCACQLHDSGVLDKYGVEMIGATREVIYRAEDRKIFNETMAAIGLNVARNGIAHNMDQAWAVLDGDGKEPPVGLPAIIRPAFTLGGTGGGIAYNREEFEDQVRRGLDASMTRQVLIDQSLLGWKEYELEVMRDRADNVVIICSIENLDPMGVHTGDSITVAPAQTLTDKEYQRMRDASIAIIRAVGVETGGSNIQFAINPDPAGEPGDMIVIEMNPRVSRSSALASKATGFPIAKIAAKLAIGYTLWELPNDITGKTVACFEPTIDYVVTKIPRFAFEKFPEADTTLTTQMKSVGEAMSIGRTFKESLQKGIRSMEIKRFGLGLDHQDQWLAGLRGMVAWMQNHEPESFERIRGLLSGEAGRLGTSLQAAAMLLGDAEQLGEFADEARQRLETMSQQMRDADLNLPETHWPIAEEQVRHKLAVPNADRLPYLRYAMKLGWSIDDIYRLTSIDPWFLDQLKQLVDFERVLISYEALDDLPHDVLFKAKQLGYSDAQLACVFLGHIDVQTILQVRDHRQSAGVNPVYKLVDTCAAEFEAMTPYYYSTYETPITTVVNVQRAGSSTTPAPGDVGTPGDGDNPARRACEQSLADDEIRVTGKKKVIILGGGPNRIGQGIEFDYCCVQAAFAADELGYESVMVNSNPETVSTDYDTSDLLFFEPLTLEDVLNICERLNGAPLQAPRAGSSTAPVPAQAPGAEDGPAHCPGRDLEDTGLLHGVIVQFGGQTPLNLAHGLETAGVPIIGTSVDSIDLAEDRRRFAELMKQLNIDQPANGIAMHADEAVAIANRIEYPVLVRPSFVLGGRAMKIVHDDDELRHYMHLALGASDIEGQPILIDKFLADAIECDVDVVADFPATASQANEDHHALVCGIMEHIEEAGVHSGDSACAIPPYSLPDDVVDRIKEHSRDIAEALQVRGLMNVQWAVKQQGTTGRSQAPTATSGELNANSDASAADIYVLEVNPRASRTIPFVGKATGVAWANIAAKVMIGKQLTDLGHDREMTPTHTSVKESVFPFNKFAGVDVILGPEMKSTGEVMGADPGFAVAFAKSQMAASTQLPTAGKVFLSVRDADKEAIVPIAASLVNMGLELYCTAGTHDQLKQHNVLTNLTRKILEGRPNAEDLIKNRELELIINTPTRKGYSSDEGRLRAMATRFGVPMITTIAAASAAVQAIAALQAGDWTVSALQDYYE